MTSEIIIRYIHFIGIFTVFAAVVSEHLQLSSKVTRGQLRRLSSLDAVYGVSALMVLITGLLLWFMVGKPDVIYTKNAVFHSKLLLFVILGLTSLYPTLFFIKNRKGPSNEEVNVPKPVIMCIRLELLILVLIPLLASAMAKGVGYFG